MNNKRKKSISFLLAVILFISVLPQILLANTPLVYMVDGVIKMEFENKKAQTGTRFKTVGWIVHAKDGNGEAAKTQKYGKMIDNDFEQKGEEETAPGILTTYFEIKEDIVSQAFINAGLGMIPDGQTVYLDSVFTVTHNGVSNGKYYYTLKDIQNAAPWGSQTMKDLEAYFDIPITFKSSEYPVNRDIFVNGELVESKELTQLKAGEPYVVSFPETYKMPTGETAVLEFSQEYYNLLRGSYMNKRAASDPKALNRPMNNPIGGMTHEGKYVIPPTVTVKHIDKDKNIVLDEFSEKVQPGQTYSASKKDFSPLKYIYSVISNDGGKTWKDRSDKDTRNIIATKDSIIAFYYSEQTDILADLTIRANPDSIAKGSTDTVKFVLDARSSTSKYPIEKWEFWFGEDKSDLNGSPDYTVDASTKEVTKNGVEPRSTWYGKVRITDTRGNTSEATSEITIKEKQEEAKVTANIDVEFLRSSSDFSNVHNLVDYINRIEMVEKDDRFPNSENRPAMVIYLDKPNDFFLEDGTARYGLDFDVEVSGRRSKSTNGIGKTEIYYNYNSSEEQMQEGDSYNKSTVFEEKALDADDATWIWKQLESNKYDWVSKDFALTAYDSVDTSKSDMAKITVYFVGVPNEEDTGLKPPTVNLAINQNKFTYGETALFTPSFYEEPNKTFPILDKSWEIGSTETDYKVEGKGEIPKQYKLDLAEGQYYAKQYIYYRDQYENDMSTFAEVNFEIVGMRDPDVSISSDKEKYYVPTTGIFTVTYDEDPKYTHHIDAREYALKNQSGEIIAQGEGTFPREYFFDDTLPSGYYTAEQTIHWWALGEYKSKTALCTFKLISPIPSADFMASMKMSTDSDDWLRIDVPGESGKQYKQIRIDLTPSIQLNQELENPNPIDFTSVNTQIQILPLTDDLQADRSKNPTIHTPNASDKQLVDNTITFKGKQYIDVRFDEPGKYRIKAKVASGKYVSQWVVRDIVIRKDLPPIVDLEIQGVNNQDGNYFTYRSNDDLRVSFNVNATATTQDEDTIDYSTGKLEIRYDYNADFDTSNDGVHSAMWITQNGQNLQPYVTATKDAQMRNFSLKMFDATQPILGKIRLEYLVAETPTIPNFLGGSMPAVPLNYGSSYALPDNKKILWVDNKQGSIKMYLEGKTKKEVNIMMGTDTLFFDINTLKDYFGDEISIYIIDKNGNRERIH